VTVTVLDAGGRAIPGLNVTLSATGSGNTLVQPSAATDAAGQTNGSYSSAAAGLKEVSASVGGIDIADRAQVTVTSAATLLDPARTDAKVAKGHRNRPSDITIESRDSFGDELESGGFASGFSITVTGANQATPTVTDNGDGTYSSSYTPTSKGNDLIAITFNGVSIKGSPYHSDVK
jgi:adhesin/invasin